MKQQRNVYVKYKSCKFAFLHYCVMFSMFIKYIYVEIIQNTPAKLNLEISLFTKVITVVNCHLTTSLLVFPQKYYPPDFDPSKIPKLKLPKDRQYVVRLMAPFNMRYSLFCLCIYSCRFQINTCFQKLIICNNNNCIKVLN